MCFRRARKVSCLAVVCFFFPLAVFNAEARQRLSPDLAGKYTETNIDLERGQNVGESESQSHVSLRRNGALVVRRRGPDFTQREVFHPSGLYTIKTKNLGGRPFSYRGRWIAKGKRLQFTLTLGRGVTIKATSVRLDSDTYRTSVRYFQRGKLLRRSVNTGRRVED